MEPSETDTEGEWLAALGDQANCLTFPVFGFEALGSDWTYRDRVLQDHLMYLVTDGSCVGEIAGSPLMLEPGSFLWMQPGARHTFKIGAAARPLTLYWFRFRFSGDRTECLLGRWPAWQRDDAWDLAEPMDQVVDELRTQLPYRNARIRALLVAICANELRRRHTTSASRTFTLNRAQRKVIETYARDHLAEWPTARDLADLVHLSHDYFTRLFTQTYGIPPRAWFMQERLRRGAHFLTESLQNVTEIAISLGYDNVNAFSYQFKRFYRTSPRAYRNLHR